MNEPATENKVNVIDMEAQGLLLDIDPFASHDGPGIRTVVYLKGCPLRCPWCHSPESQLPRPELLYQPERCTGCRHCLEACPEGAIISEVEPVIEVEIVRVKAKPVPVELQPREVRPVRTVPKALTWLGAALAFAGREIVPRLAASLLDAWDRRASHPASSPSDLTSGRSAQQSMTNPSRSRGRRHRRRRRGG